MPIATASRALFPISVIMVHFCKEEHHRKTCHKQDQMIHCTIASTLLSCMDTQALFTIRDARSDTILGQQARTKISC
jgi:hypothetical protein